MLRDRTLAALLAARLVSLAGSNMTIVALPWFVLATSGSPGRMGLVLAVQLLPVALLGLPSGGVVARLGSRRTLIVADLLRAPTLATIPVLFWSGQLSFALLLVLAALTGVFRAPYGAALHTLIPEIVGEDEAVVTKANAWTQVITQSTTVFGPIVAGVLIGIIGAASVIVVDAASFLVSALVLAAFLPAGNPRSTAIVARQRAKARVADGLRFLFGHGLLRPLVCSALVISVAHESLMGMLPVLALERFGHASDAGAIFAADGIGSVLGAALVLRLNRRINSLALIQIALCVMATALWPLPFDLPLSAVIGSMFCFGLGSMLMVPPLVSMLTLSAPTELRPNVMAAYVTVTTLAGPDGLAGAGPAIGAFGLAPVFAGIAATFTIGAVALGVATRRQRSLLQSRRPA